jgi:hypothetical protein
MASPSLTPITNVAKLIDDYLAEIAPDVNLKLPKFQSLASAVPKYARPLDDGLYRAIDIYLKVVFTGCSCNTSVLIYKNKFEFVPAETETEH